MISTIENHCQRERRNLSIRPVKRKKSAKWAFEPSCSGAWARIHPTEKKPASNNSSSDVLSIRTLRKRKLETLLPCTIRAAADSNTNPSTLSWTYPTENAFVNERDNLLKLR